MPLSPLTSLTAQARRGQRRQQTDPTTENPLAGRETGMGNQIGRSGAIGFLADKMLGGLAKSKKKAAAPKQGMYQQAMDNWRI